jgi:HlyD family secretion protein
VDEKTELLKSLKIERTAETRPSAGPAPAIAAGLIGLVLGGALGWTLKPTPKVEPPTAMTAPAAPLGPQPAAGSLVASGYVVARRQATVAAEVTGRLVEVRVEEGQAVKQGEVLAVLEATLATADVDSARARAASATADLAETKRVYERTRALARQGFASNAALTDAQARYASALAQADAARSDAERAAAQLDRYEIRAPFDGVVVTKAAQPGEIISPVSAGGGFTRTGVCTIVDMSSLEIEVDVSEAYIAKVSEGQKVEATLDAYPDVAFSAHVIATIPAADRAKATVRVRIGFDELDPRILPEMAINVRFLDPAA